MNRLFPQWFDREWSSKKRFIIYMHLPLEHLQHTMFLTAPLNASAILYVLLWTWLPPKEPTVHYCVSSCLPTDTEIRRNTEETRVRTTYILRLVLLLRLFRGHSFLHSSLISIININNVIQLNISTHPFSVANLLLLQALEILYYLRSEYLLHQFWNHWRSLQSDWLSSVWFINETFTRRQKPIRFQG